MNNSMELTYGQTSNKNLQVVVISSLRVQVYIPMADILKLGVLLEMNVARKLI